MSTICAAVSRQAGPALLLIVLLLVACAPDPEPIDAWRFEGEAAAVGDFLERLEGFEETPAARWAAATRARIAECERVVATSERIEDLAGAVRCAEEGEALSRLDDGSAWALVGPLAGGRLDARARVDDGRTRIDAVLSGSLDPGDGLESLLPRAEGVGAPRFGGPLLLHGRFGADGGLDPASWVPEGAAGDELFGLRSRLFSGALLTGVWEIAAPAPTEGESVLPLVFALETRSRTALEAATGSFVDSLRSSWGLEPSPARFEEADIEGACFDDLRVLPAFRPCWAILDDALVVGWNADALDRSLAGDRGPAAEDTAANGDAPSRLVVHLDRFPAADLLLARAALESTGPDRAGDVAADPSRIVPGAYPWSRWTVEGRREGDRYRVSVVLDP